jgi:hypothetical protein
MAPALFAGAEKNPITFEDPKAFDNTPQQEEKYRERASNRYGAFLCILKNKKIICPQLIALLLNRKKLGFLDSYLTL